MANEQQIAGSANMVSYIPDRVGLPLQTFKEVGAILTQRYWQNKQAHDSITTSLKNMRVFDEETDKPILAEKSKVIDENFKRVVETDNYHNATDNVMQIAKFVATDEDIKTIQYNVAAYDETFKKMEEGAKTNKQWANYIDDYKALNKARYKANLTKTGNKPFKMNFRTPGTDLDTNTEVEEINKAMAALKPRVYTKNGGTEYVDAETLKSLDNKYIARFASKLSETTYDVRELTINEIREAAMKELHADSDYIIKTKELAEIEHFKNSGGKLEVDGNYISKVLLANSPKELNDTYINLSPLYKDGLDKLKLAYTEAIDSGDKVLAKQLHDKYKEYEKTKDKFLENGKEAFAALNSNQLQSVYENIYRAQTTEKILATTEKHKVDESKMNKHYFSTDALIDALNKKDEESKNSTYTQAIGTGDLSTLVSAYNENSELQLNLRKSEAALIAARKSGNKQQIHDAEANYNFINGQLTSINKALTETWNNLSPEDRANVFKEAGSWSASTSAALQGKTFDSVMLSAFSEIGSFGKDLKGSIGRLLGFNSRTNNLELETYARQVFNKIQPTDLLTLNDKQFINKYFKDVRPENYSEVASKINFVRNNLAKAISNQPSAKLMTPVYEIRTLGDVSAEDLQVRDAIISQGLSSKDGLSTSLIDMSTGQPLDTKDLFYKKSDKPSDDDVNDNGGIQVTRLYSSIYNGKKVYKITAPQIETEGDDKGKETGKVITKIVQFQGNDQLVDEADGVQMKRLAESNKFKPSAAKQSTYWQLAQRIGSNVQDDKGTYIQTIVNDLNIAMTNNPNFKRVERVDLYNWKPGKANQPFRNQLVINIDNTKIDGKVVISTYNGITTDVISTSNDVKDVLNFLGSTKALLNGNINRSEYDDFNKNL